MKTQFRIPKKFDVAGAFSNHTKVSLPGQMAWVQLLAHPISSNSGHLAELDGPQNSAKNYKNV